MLLAFLCIGVPVLLLAAGLGLILWRGDPPEFDEHDRGTVALFETLTAEAEAGLLVPVRTGTAPRHARPARELPKPLASLPAMPPRPPAVPVPSPSGAPAPAAAPRLRLTRAAGAALAALVRQIILAAEVHLTRPWQDATGSFSRDLLAGHLSTSEPLTDGTE